MTRVRQLTHHLGADLVGRPIEVRVRTETTRPGIKRLRYPGWEEADRLDTRGLQ